MLYEVITLLFDRTVRRDPRQLGIGRLDRQLSTHPVLGEIDGGFGQVGQAVAFDIEAQQLQIQNLIPGIDLVRATVRQAGFGVGGARLRDEQTFV